MTTTKSIDERIRQKAREELKTDIGQKFKAAYSLLTEQGPLSTEIIKHNGTSCTAWTCLEAAEKAIFSAMAAKAEERAVSDFLAKIDELQYQIDSLASEYRD